MLTVKLIVLFLHFIGLSSLLGGALAQAREAQRRITPGMRDGAFTMLVTGLLLVGLDEPNVNHAKVGLKLLALIVIIALVLANRRRAIDASTLWAIAGLTALNVGIAVFWR